MILKWGSWDKLLLYLHNASISGESLHEQNKENISNITDLSSKIKSLKNIYDSKIS